mmetsp:Transcript_69797/g.221074  ORF Transcript_69797/g.221074 Transcript_69797/m.221074 type:complete len:250 (+) Transcript_69797:906-1655(+)
MSIVNAGGPGRTPMCPKSIGGPGCPASRNPPPPCTTAPPPSGHRNPPICGARCAVWCIAWCSDPWGKLPSIIMSPCGTNAWAVATPPFHGSGPRGPCGIPGTPGTPGTPPTNGTLAAKSPACMLTMECEREPLKRAPLPARVSVELARGIPSFVGVWDTARAAAAASSFPLREGAERGAAPVPGSVLGMPARAETSTPWTESITPWSFLIERDTLLILRHGHLAMPCWRQILLRVVGHTRSMAAASLRL